MKLVRPKSSSLPKEISFEETGCQPPHAMDKPKTSPTATPVAGQIREVCLCFRIATTTKNILAYFISYESINY